MLLKILPPPGFVLRTIQLVSIRCTEPRTLMEHRKSWKDQKRFLVSKVPKSMASAAV